jgi:16S rRNA U516 pseudouridylate synthase RsuA-like enzyme
MYLGGPESRRLQFTLVEGRNRQIRKMCEALGFEVTSLHRVTFAGISLKGLSSNNWSELSEKEMLVIQCAMKKAAETGSRMDAEIDEYDE